MSFKSNSDSDDIIKDLRLDMVDKWPFVSGKCTKSENEDLEKYGSGIFILNYLDLLTQCLPPETDHIVDPQDLYSKIAVELLTTNLLNYI